MGDHADIDHSGLTGVGAADHGALTGLSDDDHPQYIKDAEFGAKGRILVGTGSGTFDDLPAGTNGHILTLDSGETTGVKWAANAGAADILDLPTTEMDDSLVLAPDGAGGVEFRAEAGGGGGAGVATAPAFVQRKTSVSNTQNPGLTLDSTPTNGNVLFAFIGANGRAVSSISQSNVTWTLLSAYNGNSQYVEVWKGVVGASASTSVTVNTGSSNWISVGIIELDISDLTYVQRATNTGSGAPPSHFYAGPVDTDAGTLVAFVVSEGNGSTSMRPEISGPHAPIVFLDGTGVCTVGYGTGSHMYGWSGAGTNTAWAGFLVEMTITP